MAESAKVFSGSWKLSLIVLVNALLSVGIALYFFISPAFLIVRALKDPALRNRGIPGIAFYLHRRISPGFAAWVRNRIASGRGALEKQSDVAGTEWPPFACVFYLWTTENLQDEWDKNPGSSPVAPRQYGQAAIEAAAALLIDPAHATWVRNYWGDNYLHEQNLFYRMLLIGGLTSYEKLTRRQTHHALLQDQVESLAAELDGSPFGLLDDYPGQCYPVDVLPAIAVIRRADSVLGTDHSAFTARAVRGFTENRLDPATELPAYDANAKTGQGRDSARGVGISLMLIWAAELWPQTAEDWYRRYENYFWKDGSFLSGVFEYPKTRPVSRAFLFDIDAGPILFGYGTVASAFGIGAARANGHFEEAYPLSAEALIASWPLANGTLLVPRQLSSLADSPYHGELALLFNLTRQPLVAQVHEPTSRLPSVVYLGLAIYVGVGLLILSFALNRALRWSKKIRCENSSYVNFQLGTWIVLLIAAGGAFIKGWHLIAVVLFLIAQLLPQNERGSHLPDLSL